MPSRSNICSWLKRPYCRLAQIYSHNMPEQQNWPPHACPQAALPAAAPRAKGRSSGGEPQRRRRQEVSQSQRARSAFSLRSTARPLFLLCPFAHGTDGGQDHEVRTRKGEGVGRTSDRRPLLDREQSTSSAMAIFRKEVSDQTKYGLWIWFD